MRPFTYLSLLPSLAWASPLTLLPRQNQATITGVSFSGPGCTSGTTTADFATNGQSVTLGFDDYLTEINPGGTIRRELFCDVTVTLRFPIACTNVNLATTYHGFAQIDNGVTGRFTSQYTLSPGALNAGSSPPPSVFTSAQYGGVGQTYTKLDTASGSVTVRDANQRSVSLVVRTRVALTQQNSNAGAIASVEDANIEITSQSRC